MSSFFSRPETDDDPGWKLLPRWLRRNLEVPRKEGKQEAARRRRQMERGILNDSNKGTVEVAGE